MAHYRPFPMAFSVLLFATTPSSPNASAQSTNEKPLPTLADIAHAWRRREDRIHTAEFVWKEVRISTISPSQRRPFIGRGPTSTGSPNQTYLDEYEMEFLFKPDKVLFRDETPAANSDRSAYEPSKRVWAFDGQVAAGYFLINIDKATPHHGFRSEDKDKILDIVHTRLQLWPVLIHFRPSKIDPLLFSQGKVATNQSMVGSDPCVILDRVKPGTTVVESFWLDRAQEFCVRRYVSQVDDKTRGFDISYSHDARYGPIPTGWKYVRFSRGKFEESFEATELTALVNHEMLDDRFRVDMPVNTLVTDTVGAKSKARLDPSTLQRPNKFAN